MHVLTISVGRAHVRGQFLGETVRDPRSGQPLDHLKDRWTPFCREVLGLETPIDIDVEVPEAAGREISDITAPPADVAFANACYARTAALTRPGEPPVVGSVAGGRKTMGAHLTTAFSVYARPVDRLTHVLVTPTSAESNPELFWPDPQDPEAMQVHRVDLPFPRLHALLREDLIAGLPSDRRDLEGILNALEPHLALNHTPTRVLLRLGGGEARLRLEDEGRTLGTCRLSPAVAATLLILAEAIETAGDAVRTEDLYAPKDPGATEEQHLVHRCRLAVVEACDRFPNLEPWTAREDFQKAISRLRKALEPVPIAAKYFAPESAVSAEETRYRWPEPLPVSIEIEAMHMSDAPEDWPFDHLPTPELSA